MGASLPSLQVLLALACAVLGVALVLSSRRRAVALRSALELRQANEALVQSLRQDHETLQRARHDAEEAMRAAERADQGKSRFLAGASHDLLQPMHAMGLLTGLLRERITEPEARYLVERIESLTTRMEVLLHTLLELSRRDSGTLPVNLADFDLDQIFQEIKLSAVPVAAAKGLELRVRRCRCRVRSDAVLLGRILQNLVDNAVRYTSSGRVVLGARRHGATLRIQVLDTGPGIPAEHQERIFTEFVRGPASASNVTPGFGLGLSIVERSARLLGHPLSLRSRVGAGSCFEIEVPRSELSAAPDAAAPRGRGAEARGPLAGTFVAVLDEDAQRRAASVRQMHQWGCHVVCARGASELLQELGAHLRTPDVLIAELRSDRDPIAEVRALSAIWDAIQERIPTIAISAAEREQDGAALRALGVAVLARPLAPERLQAEVLARSGPR